MALAANQYSCRLPDRYRSLAQHIFWGPVVDDVTLSFAFNAVQQKSCFAAWLFWKYVIVTFCHSQLAGWN